MEIVLERNGDGTWPAVTLPTGARHKIIVKRPVLEIERRYHDDNPVHGAPFTIELADGKTIEGKLDSTGRAQVPLPAPARRIQFGPDERDWTLVDREPNPDYQDDLGDVDAFVAERLDDDMNEAEHKSTISQVGSWLWGTIEGGFNEQQSISQIIVDGVIGMIPIVGDVTAVRDLVATILRLVEDPKKREDKLEWAALVLLLFALIPVAGGFIKGIGKLLLKAGEEAGRHAELIRDVMNVLNHIGDGNSVRFFRALNLETYTAELMGKWRQLMQRLDEVIDATLRRTRFLIPDAMVARLEQIRTGLRELKTVGERMIPDAVKELNRRLKAVQKQLYEGEWHDIPGTLKSATREAEARLVEKADDEGKLAKQWELHGAPFPPDAASAFHHVEGWPDLRDAPWTDGKNAWVVASFSGPIRPVKIPGGTKLRRIVTKTSKKNGSFWSYELARDGKSWREDSAVLEEWSANGFYVEMVVPPEGIWAWEGRIASQIESNVSSATAGQVLRGGGTQVFIDFDFPAHSGLSTIADSRFRIPTNWTDHLNVNVPEKTVEVQRLGVNEIEPKNTVGAAAAASQRALRSSDRDRESKTGGGP